MGLLEKMMNIDRRVIFVFVAAAIVIPSIIRLKLPIKPSPMVVAYYKAIESLPSGSVVLVSSDYDPGSMAELYPMTLATFRHCFSRNLKVIGMGLWPQGIDLTYQALQEAAKEYGKKEGEDYVMCGYKAGAAFVIVGLGQDLPGTLEKDVRGRDLKSLPLFRKTKIRSLRDIPLVISMSAGTPGIDTWIVYGRDQFGFRMIGGCTGVMAPDFYPYLNTGQLEGLLGAAKGAADYETLIKRPAMACQMMDPQTIAHLVIIIFILLGNLSLLLSILHRRRKT